MLFRSKQDGVMVFSVSVGKIRVLEPLRRLASLSGGQYFGTPDASLAAGLVLEMKKNSLLPRSPSSKNQGRSSCFFASFKGSGAPAADALRYVLPPHG